jgi:hypothetical protein
MNDWQAVYEGTRHVTPAALLTIARLRAALADGAVTGDQVSAALAGGGDGIGELLESAYPEDVSGTESFAENFEESFTPFGRLV